MKETPSQPQLPEISPAILQAFMALFFPRPDLYAIQTQTGRYVARKVPVTPELVQDHLHGKVTLGTYALSEDSLAQWAVVDADDRKQWKKLLRMVDDNDLPVYLEGSRRGGHVWLFFESQISGREARLFAQGLLKPYKLEGIEIFPKQDELSTGPGSLIRLPLGFHRKVKIEGQPGKRFTFLKRNGTPLAPSIREQLALLAYAERVPQAVVERLVKQAEVQPIPTPSKPKALFPTQPTHDERPLSERIKTSVSVFDFVSRYVDLDGNTGHGKCPFHEDENPSFGVNKSGNFWSCFAGCGGGSVIDFWQLYRERVLNQDGSFIATIKDLADLLGL